MLILMDFGSNCDKISLNFNKPTEICNCIIEVLDYFVTEQLATADVITNL